MKRKIFSIFFAVVLVLSFSLVTAVPAAAGGTIQVDVNNLDAVTESGQGDSYSVVYKSIQDAVTDADTGDTINVAAGTYLETISIAKNDLTIQSVSGNPSDTVIDADDADGNIVAITDCSGVTLSGFTITGAASRSRGIQMLGATGCTISNIVVTETGPLTVGGECAAIYLQGSSGNSFDSVEVSEISGGQVSGILLTGANSNTFASTTISGITTYSPPTAATAKGIWVTGGENNEFVDTEVTGITSIDSKAYGIYADGNGNTFTSTEVSDIQGRTRVAGIQICHTTGVEFSDYHISNLTAEAYDSWGIRVASGVTDCTFSGGSITGADIGFFVEKNELGTGNSIHNTNIVGNRTFGVQNTSAPTLDATNNWWGSATPDFGTIISGNVDYDPWYADEGMTKLASNKPVRNITQDTFHSTIQDAINVATAGDTINVAAGTYDENVVIPVGKDGLQLRGAGSGVTSIAPASGRAVALNGHLGNINGFAIKGFTLKTADVNYAFVALSGTAGVQPDTTSLELEDIVVDGCRGISLNAVDGATLTNVHLSNISGWGDGALELTGVSNLTFTDGSIEGNAIGVRLQMSPDPSQYGVNGDIQIHNSNLTGNTMAVENQDIGIEIDAALNWWGDASGPYHPVGNPKGLGNAVSGNVAYNPWLLQPKDVSQTYYDHTLALQDGWNLISTPKILESEDLDELIVGETTDFYTYDNNKWNIKDSIEPLDALFVKMNEAGGIGFQWTTDEMVAPPTKQLEESWNLVGPSVNLPTELSVLVDEALDSVSGSWSTVYSPALNKVAWTVTTATAGSTDMLPYEGYWIYMTAADELAGRTI